MPPQARAVDRVQEGHLEGLLLLGVRGSLSFLSTPCHRPDPASLERKREGKGKNTEREMVTTLAAVVGSYSQLCSCWHSVTCTSHLRPLSRAVSLETHSRDVLNHFQRGADSSRVGHLVSDLWLQLGINSKPMETFSV